MPDDRRVLEGIVRLVVDGTNVLHAIRRSPVPLPAVALIGRLRAIVPPGVAITVVLDGSPEHGLVARHVASGVEVRYSGRASADEFIVRLLDDLRPETAGTLVVTDDIDLSSTVRRSGARTVRAGWLVDRLERQRLVAPAPGRPGLVPPRPAAIGQGTGRSSSNGSLDAADPDAPEPPRWSPGRGATRKRGPAHRRPAGER
ncbi:MAG: NYN domain-containing protein [Candidatus Limnocylindrales bacterium]